LLLVAFSLTLHLWDLGGRSYHHDEAIHAHAAHVILKEGTYQYDPTYHGPLLYYLTAATFIVAGESDFTARLPIALAGVALIAVAWSLRRPFGPRAAWWMALLVTISPICLYYGRFLRMDILEALVASAAFVALWRAVHGSTRAWAWFGVWVGLAFATKENAFVTAALVGGVLALVLIHSGLRQMVPRTLRWIADHRWNLLTAVAAAVVVTVPLFTVGFRHPGDWFFPYKAISYWWGQHPILAGLIWAARRGRRMRTLEWSLLLFGIGSIAMYCYLGEKVPWLGVHQVWAFIPLAGLQLARTFGPHGVWWSRALASVGLTATLVTALVANFVLDEISPNLERVEALVYVQTSPEILEPMNEGLQMANEGIDPVAAVGGDAGWPLSWYWRRLPVWWADLEVRQRPPLVFCSPEQEPTIRRRLGAGYESERLPLRSWWVMEDFKPSLVDILRYVFTRRPWGTIGSTDTILLRRTGEEVEESRAAPVPQVLATALGVGGARVFGEGWMVEPRGIGVSNEGELAVADPGLGEIIFFDAAQSLQEGGVPEPLKQPEAVTWTPDGVLVIADTWNHRVLVYRPETKAVRPLPEPPDGWYGPRAVAVAEDGTVAVADTGHKRIVLISGGPDPKIETIGREGSGPGELVEPVGVAWLDRRRLVVCDTGNHRLQVLDRRGRALAEVSLPDAWADFYSRPQIFALAEDRWLVTDTPANSLWLVEHGVAQQIDLTDVDIKPSGLARKGNILYVADLGSRVWAFELPKPD
jgi:predicted membrane-bound mannosyltransferase